MELNTSGVHKIFAEMNPSNAMLKMMRARNIPVVIGSDSHRPQRVGEAFPAALRNLEDAGYDRVSVFKDRKPTEILIKDALESLSQWSQSAEA
jgi:histidinol-phosphatase (PHP family)